MQVVGGASAVDPSPQVETWGTEQQWRRRRAASVCSCSPPPPPCWCCSSPPAWCSRAVCWSPGRRSSGRSAVEALALSAWKKRVASLKCETCAIMNEGHRESDKEFAASDIRATLLASGDPGQGRACGQTYNTCGKSKHQDDKSTEQRRKEPAGRSGQQDPAFSHLCSASRKKQWQPLCTWELYLGKISKISSNIDL